MPKFKVITQETVTYEVEVEAGSSAAAWKKVEAIIEKDGGAEFVETDSASMEVTDVFQVKP